MVWLKADGLLQFEHLIDEDGETSSCYWTASVVFFMSTA